MTGSRARLDARGGEGLLRAALIVIGVYHLGLGALMVLAPDTFFAEIGPFGVQNDHYIRDTATYNLAAGSIALVAVSRRSWRVPVLVFLVIQFALHSVNHLVDIDEAEPSSVGIFDFAALVIATVLLAVLLSRMRQSRTPAGRSGR
jgi:hypothetical protein